MVTSSTNGDDSIIDLDELATLCETALPPYRLVTGERAHAQPKGQAKGQATTMVQDRNGVGIADLLTPASELNEHDAMLVAVLNAAPTLVPELRAMRSLVNRYSALSRCMLRRLRLISKGEARATTIDVEMWTALVDELEAERVQARHGGPPEKCH